MKPLRNTDIGALLEYWWAAVRTEQALGQEIRVAPKSNRPGPPNLRGPSRGANYFKLVPGREAADVAAFLGGERSELALPLDDERGSFLEHWLLRRWNRARRGITSDASDTWVVGFPVIHLARRGRLVMPLRVPLDPIDWLDAKAQTWSPPEPGARRVPESPTGLVVRHLPSDAVEDDADRSPRVDGERLRRLLGLSDDVIQTFDAWVRKAGTAHGAIATGLAALARDGEQWVAPEADAMPAAGGVVDLAWVAAALDTRLRGPDSPAFDARAWPVALVYDGGDQGATWHLERDLEALAHRHGRDGGWRKNWPVRAFLSGARPPAARVVLRGTDSGSPPTPDQRGAAEAGLGGVLTAIEGPPGTGKTALARHILADGLVERVATFVRQGRMAARPWTLVTSTNNRAVDHAIAPLLDPVDGPEAARGLPIALRLGSKIVTMETTRDILLATRDWLASRGGPPDSAPPALATARDAFAEALKAWKSGAAPYEEALRAAGARTKAESKLATLRGELAALPEPTVNDALSEEILLGFAPALDDLRILDHRLDGCLSAARGSVKRKIRRLPGRWTSSVAPVVGRLRRKLEAMGEMIELDLPPSGLEGMTDIEAMRDAWSPRLEAALDAVSELELRLEDRRDAVRLASQRRSLEADIETARAAVDAVGDADEASAPDALGPLGGELYDRAREVRARWATVHREPLIAAVDEALERIGARRSLRGLFEEEEDAAHWLRCLFPTIGCTLLSLGNAFPMEPGVFDRVIVDEAGQCHPAYAVSALYRAKRAWVTGDVHQLAPVLQLRAEDDVRVRRRLRLELDEDQAATALVDVETGASAQSRAEATAGEALALRTHFRCQPEIIAISDAICTYDLDVRTPASSLADRWSALVAPVLGVAVTGEARRVWGSWSNPAEVEAVGAIVTRAARAGVAWEDIAILTPYRGQLEGLRRRLQALGVPAASGDTGEAIDAGAALELALGGRVALGTVHRFQGGERRLVIFTTVAACPRSIRFVDEHPNLLNVAVSRARDHLVVVGDPHTLAGGRWTRHLVAAAAPLEFM